MREFSIHAMAIAALFSGAVRNVIAEEKLPGTGAGGNPPVYAAKCAQGARDASGCEVDKDTYAGWRTFSANCQVCHGGSGMGTTFAPNLMERLNTRVDYGRFKYVLENGYKGQVGAMPSWKPKPDVMANVDNLYRYLRARADDKLPAGRPEKTKN